MEQVDETVLDEAGRLVFGARQSSYGHPREDFARTAAFWSQILGVDVTPSEVALCMVALKMSRAVNQLKAVGSVERDTLVDMAGYSQTLELCQE